MHEWYLNHVAYRAELGYYFSKRSDLWFSPSRQRSEKSHWLTLKKNLQPTPTNPLKVKKTLSDNILYNYNKGLNYSKQFNRVWYILVPFVYWATLKPGACTMMVAEQTQGYRISFELTKPNQSNPALLVPWSWSSTFCVNSGLILIKNMERVHMNVWHQ